MSWVQKKTAFKAALVTTLGWAFLPVPLSRFQDPELPSGAQNKKTMPFMAFPGRESCVAALPN